MKIKKGVGTFLLILGILIIIYTLYVSYGIISGTRSLPEVFPLIEKKETSGKEISLPKNLEEIQQAQKELIAEQISQLFPPDYLQRVFNLIAWSVISAIFIFGGAQIGNLGIKLMK